MRLKRNDASTEKARKQWLFNVVDDIIEGGDLPGDHLVRMLMRDLNGEIVNDALCVRARAGFLDGGVGH